MGSFVIFLKQLQHQSKDGNVLGFACDGNNACKMMNEKNQKSKQARSSLRV
jgi:hypothetical protein